FGDGFFPSETRDPARQSMKFLKNVQGLQDAFTAVEKCSIPVIAAVSGACIGAEKGIDLITACDIRYCTANTKFSVKEVDIGLAADLGTLQRLPKVVGNQSAVREWCLTGRMFQANEALQFGLVNNIFENKEQMMVSVMELAAEIASKSPIALQGTKKILNYSRDHTVEEGLDYVAIWNSAMIHTE
ncbi:putative enoyl CoA hydratase, partial [Nowakowskiella sp. JEL0078]